MNKKKTNIVYGSESKEKYSSALKDLLTYYEELDEEKIIMAPKKEHKCFDKRVQKVMDGYDLVNFEIDKYASKDVPEIYSQDSLNNGNPLRYRPFPSCLFRIIRTCFSRSLNCYPSTVGSSRARQDLVNYFIKEGFPKEDNTYCNGINVHNVAFASSTTQAFGMILKVIARKHDVIIIPAPTYGIFAGIAEKLGVTCETIDLKEENNFFINPKELNEKITSINEQLKKDYQNLLDYVPKCVAYLNINPHNPIGNVMTKDNLSLIKEIGDVCLEKSVFIIDDLIYRDLTFDRNNLAFPIASIPKYFNNTISLFGLSKAFGLAGFRAGFIVMPTPIFWGYATEIFDLMDSVPVLQVEAVRGAFNGSAKRYKKYDKYFKKLIPKYLYQLDLVTALIYGINSIKDEKIKQKIIKDIAKYNDNYDTIEEILAGIKGVEIRKNTYPQSGFFIIVDFTALKGKYYKGEKIQSEYDLLKAMFNYGKVRYLMGENFIWPYKDEFVARVNFAVSKKALIHNFYQINCLVRMLKDEPNKKDNL